MASSCSLHNARLNVTFELGPGVIGNRLRVKSPPPEPAVYNEKRNIRDKASKYIVEKNLLYIQEKDKQSDLIRKRRVIVKEEDKQGILAMCHSGVDGMHFGRDKTYGKVS